MKNNRGLAPLEWVMIAAILLAVIGVVALATGFKLELSAWTAPFDMLGKAEKLTPGTTTPDFIEDLQKSVLQALWRAIGGRILIVVAVIIFVCFVLGLPLIEQILRKW